MARGSSARSSTRSCATRRRSGPSPGPTSTRRATACTAAPGCGAELFASDTKFDSGTGWPSFTDPMVAEAVELREDRSVRHGPHGGAPCAPLRARAPRATSFDDGPGARRRSASASTPARWSSTAADVRGLGVDRRRRCGSSASRGGLDPVGALRAGQHEDQRGAARRVVDVVDARQAAVAVPRRSATGRSRALDADDRHVGVAAGRDEPVLERVAGLRRPRSSSARRRRATTTTASSPPQLARARAEAARRPQRRSRRPPWTSWTPSAPPERRRAARGRSSSAS